MFTLQRKEAKRGTAGIKVRISFFFESVLKALRIPSSKRENSVDRLARNPLNRINIL